MTFFRSPFFRVGVVCVFAVNAFHGLASAQNRSDDPPKPKESPISVSLWQFDFASGESLSEQFDSPADLKRRVDQLAERGKLVRSSSLQMRALTNLASTYQYGKRVPVTVGITSSRGGISRQMSNIEVGTTLQAITRLDGDVVYAELSYSSSYTLPSEKEESTPAVANLEIKATTAAKLGEVVLLTKQANGANSSYVFVQFTSAGKATAALRSRIEAMRRAGALGGGGGMFGGSRGGATGGSRGGVIGGSRSGARLGPSAGGFAPSRAGGTRAGGSRFGGAREAARSSGGQAPRPPASPTKKNTPKKDEKPKAKDDAKSGGQAGSKKPVDPRYAKYAEAFFRKYDTNDDNVLSKDEFSGNERMLTVVEQADANNDGKVTVEEFIQRMTRGR